MQYEICVVSKYMVYMVYNCDYYCDTYLYDPFCVVLLPREGAAEVEPELYVICDKVYVVITYKHRRSGFYRVL
jgi:hypothetical protein